MFLQLHAFFTGGSSNTMVMGVFDQQDSPPPLMTSSGTCTPTPTSTSNLAPQAQVGPHHSRVGAAAAGIGWQAKLDSSNRAKFKQQYSSSPVGNRGIHPNGASLGQFRESPDEGIQDDVTTDV